MSDATSDTPDTGTDEYGMSAIRDLLQLIEQSDITEILIERGESKLHIKRGHAFPTPHPVAMAPMLQQPLAPMPMAGMPMQQVFTPPAAPETPPAEIPAGHTITAPMVGTFYSAASPKDPPFVQEGDEVHAGDSIGIIEAMKMMNEIESDIAGKVTRILVKNGQPVEYGQPLLVVEPH